LIADVDCTQDSGKELCQTYGVQGYPTIKYFNPTTPTDGETYEEGRDFKSLSSFVEEKSKKPCDPDTLVNCDKKDTAFIEEIKGYDDAKLKEEREALEKKMGDLSSEQKAAADLFEEQKDVAIATMKRAEDLKTQLSKLQKKEGYKLFILKAKTEPKKEEL